MNYLVNDYILAFKFVLLLFSRYSCGDINRTVKYHNLLNGYSRNEDLLSVLFRAFEGICLKFGYKGMRSNVWRWFLGLIYIVAVATIWIAASFVVQSVVDAGVSPFLITYICNSLFIVYIPLVEIGRYLEDEYGSLQFWRNRKHGSLQELQESEEVILLGESDTSVQADRLNSDVIGEQEDNLHEGIVLANNIPSNQAVFVEECNEGLDAKGRWTRTRVAKVSLLICPFWFLAQLTFNLSLKYTTVTVSVFKL